MGIFLLVLFLVFVILAVVGLFVPRRLFEIGVIGAIVVLGLRVFVGL